MEALAIVDGLDEAANIVACMIEIAIGAAIDFFRLDGEEMRLQYRLR